MFGNDPAILADHDAIRISLDLNGPLDRACRHRVLVVVEAHQTGLGDRGRDGMEAVEPTRIWHEIRSLGLEDFPDGPVGELRMPMRLGVGDTFIEQPGVQLVQRLEAQPRREEPFSEQPDLVLDLTLLPARRRRAGNRIDQIMAAHLQEAAIVETAFADEDRLHRRLHVVVDAAPAGPLEQRKRPVVGVKNHLLRLARIGPNKQHPTVAKPDMRRLHDHRGPAQQDYFVAPVKLVGFSRRKAQRDVSRRRRLSALLAPAPRIAPNRIVAAGISKAAKLFEQADQRQPFAPRLVLVRRQQPVKLSTPRTHLRKRLRLSLVPEIRRFGTDDLADHLARYAKLPADRLDGLTMNKIGATDLRNRLPHQHPNLGFHDLMEATVDPCPGVPIGCRLPRIRGPYSMPKHMNSPKCPSNGMVNRYSKPGTWMVRP